MLFKKLYIFPGHSHKIYWLWPLFIVIAMLLILIIRSWRISPTSDMDTPDSWWVRVLLFSNDDSCRLSAPKGFTVELSNGAVADFDSSEDFDIQLNKLGFKIGDGIYTGQQILIKPKDPYVFTINSETFRGNLRLVVRDNGKFDAVNIVPMESYLAGVIGAEMPRYWRGEALKAQAIASRTYCLYYKKTYGSGRDFDIRRTQANQVYAGLAKEYRSTRNAANETSGQIMFCDGQVFPAFFGSSCGGHTDSSKDVFGKEFDCVKAVPCPYCQHVAKKSQFFWGPVEMTPAQLTQKLADKYETIKPLGEIVEIQPRRKSQYDGYYRWTSVKLIGKTGKSITLRGEDFRLALDSTGLKIKSTIFELAKISGKWVFYSGRGFGHGVGLCQCGAQKLAKDGFSAEDILTYYYPGAKIIKMY